MNRNNTCYTNSHLLYLGSEILRRIDKEGQRLHQPDACPATIYAVLLKCWAKNPQDRPSFANLKDFFRKSGPIVMKAQSGVDEGSDDKMAVEEKDEIAVIDGNVELYWWKGQNLRTFKIGLFPRYIYLFHIHLRLKRYII